MKNIILITVIFYLLVSCKKETRHYSSEIIKPSTSLEKIIIVNRNEDCLTIFKLKIKNPNKKSLVFLDNSLVETLLKKIESSENAFYLKNFKNNKIITLGIDNYHFYQIPSMKEGYFFITAYNLGNSFIQKDSLLLKDSLENYLLEYNGKNLDLNKIEKTQYISQNAYDNFIKNKKNLIAFKDKLSIPLSSKNIKLKYINYLPITSEEWNNL